MKSELEFANCGFCGSESYKTLYQAPEYSPYRDCFIVQCNYCGLVRTNPRPNLTHLQELYVNSEYYSKKAPKFGGVKSKIKIYAMRHNLIYLYANVIPFKIPQNAAICDIGCGAGEWLSRMRTAYPQAEIFGFETDKETAETAAMLSGADVRYGNFLNNGWPSNAFNVITFWDVLEHIPNPLQVMQEVKRLLKPHGHVIIVSPNIECIYSQIFKQFWYALLFDQHLYHYSKNTVSQLLISCSLMPVKTYKPPICPNACWNIYILLQNMRFKGLPKRGKFISLKILGRIIECFDKIHLSRFIPQHFMMCAEKR